MSKVDSILVSFDEDQAILLVGRKTPGEVVEIVNAFQGEEARELYRKLTEKRVSGD